MTGKSVHFLLVEDDDDHAELIRVSLLAEDSIRKTVDRVRDGAGALAYLKREGTCAAQPPPHVVLLDLKLGRVGGVDGREVLAAIKSDPELLSTVVVVLTASESRPDKSFAYLHHANSYVCKPIEPGEFDRMVRSLARYWGSWNQAPEMQRR
jgi:two-component system, chemotaxis family, response regulator Rcp1